MRVINGIFSLEMRSTKYRSNALFAISSLNQRFSAGFTLLETLIVLLMLGILIMLSLPQLSSALVEARLSGAAEEIVNALEYAQLTAKTSGRNIKVLISDSSDTILLRHYKSSADLFNGGDVLPAIDIESGSYDLIPHPLNKGFDYQISLRNELRFSGIDISQSDFKPETPVYFDSMGAPSHGGTVTLTLGPRQIVVTLDDLTGKVTLSN
jgi:prepilin-type N-terminal cleavage/methylation domain-containing protein